MNRQKLAFLLLPLLLTTPVFAGTVYVPYSGDVMLGGQHYQTMIWLSNDYPDILGLAETYFIPSFQDGTVRAEGDTGVENWLAPGATRVISSAGARGMLEIEASSEVYVQARLVPVGQEIANAQGVELPVISSDNVVPANTKVQLLGWERKNDGADAYSNFGLVNLGHDNANCLVDIYRGTGEVVLADVLLTFNPLSHNQFDNVLSLLGETEASEWRFGISCDQPTLPYLSIYYPSTGSITFIEGAASGKSELQRPLTGVSSEFDYISDLPIEGWGGIEVGPFLDSSGVEFHGVPQPVGGFKPIKINGVEYAKGVSWYPLWGHTPYMEFRLDGQYAVFTSVVRIDDHFFNHYEWAVVEESTGRWIRLERPSDGFRGSERSNPIRIGAAANYRIIGDGEVLYQSGEIYAYGEPEVIEIDVRGVDILRLQLNPDGTEQLNAPHRRGLTRARLVKRCSWHDMISFGDAKVFRAR